MGLCKIHKGKFIIRLWGWWSFKGIRQYQICFLWTQLSICKWPCCNTVWCLIISLKIILSTQKNRKHINIRRITHGQGACQEPTRRSWLSLRNQSSIIIHHHLSSSIITIHHHHYYHPSPSSSSSSSISHHHLASSSIIIIYHHHDWSYDFM